MYGQIPVIKGRSGEESVRGEISPIYALVKGRSRKSDSGFFVPLEEFVSFVGWDRSSASGAEKHFNQRSKVRARAPNLTILRISYGETTDRSIHEISRGVQTQKRSISGKPDKVEAFFLSGKFRCSLNLSRICGLSKNAPHLKILIQWI